MKNQDGFGTLHLWSNPHKGTLTYHTIPNILPYENLSRIASLEGWWYFYDGFQMFCSLVVEKYKVFASFIKFILAVKVF